MPREALEPGDGDQVDGRAGQSGVFLSVRFSISFCFLLFLFVLFL